MTYRIVQKLNIAIKTGNGRHIEIDFSKVSRKHLQITTVVAEIFRNVAFFWRKTFRRKVYHTHKKKKSSQIWWREVVAVPFTSTLLYIFSQGTLGRSGRDCR